MAKILRKYWKLLRRILRKGSKYLIILKKYFGKYWENFVEIIGKFCEGKKMVLIPEKFWVILEKYSWIQKKKNFKILNKYLMEKFWRLTYSPGLRPIQQLRLEKILKV